MNYSHPAKSGEGSLFGTISWPVTVKRLDSGYWHLRSIGPCNWAQPRLWPSPSEAELEESFFSEACEAFRQVVRSENVRLMEPRGPLFGVCSTHGAEDCEYCFREQLDAL